VAKSTRSVAARADAAAQQVFRFGEQLSNSIQQQKQRWDEGVGYLDCETLDACLKLPAPQRKLIRKVILTFAKVHSGSDAVK
jgi:hypothetical protein